MNDELQRRINEYVLNGDAPSIIRAMDAQVRVNTALEAENAALWAFVRVARQYEDGYYAQMGETDAGLAIHEAFKSLRPYEVTS